MPKKRFLSFSSGLIVILLAGLALWINCTKQQTEGDVTMTFAANIQQTVIDSLISTFGEEHRSRIETGVRQVAERWQKSDGDEQAFRKFCLEHFQTDPEKGDVLFTRFQKNLESLYGNLHRISRDFNRALQVDIGPVYPVDYLFASYNPFAHVSDDMFRSKLAFAVLLNFPIYSQEEKYDRGYSWSRKQWAEVRLAEEFRSRVPASVSQKRSLAYVAADDYINNYNIFMHNLLDEQGNHLFPEGLKLISHWGLRDELKAQYANPDGLPRQKIIHQVMERIIRQEIPRQVINSDAYYWNPFQNTLYESETKKPVEVDPETNTRYQHIWNIFQAERLVDPYYPDAPSLIDRRFKIDREIAESEVEAELKKLLTAPVLKKIARLIAQRVQRPLEAFDIWYNGFKPRSKYTEAELDRIVGKRYPNVEAFQKDLPNILMKLGFSRHSANFLVRHIQVDPSRGAGHASGAMMREDKAHLRTRIPPQGMKYKGFNIAIHELGHNVEQVFSLNEMDYYTLSGVPNTAFTEAFAFVFQSRDLEILGLSGPSQKAEDLKIINDMWAAFEISGVALTDMYIWRWMYAHPQAGPDQLKEATGKIARQVWNDYFAPVLGVQDQDLLVIYSHIVDGAMYTPDYPLGHIISFQIEEYLKSHTLAREMERMCKLGRLTPQLWMQQAVGQKVSAQPLIDAATRAAGRIGG